MKKTVFTIAFLTALPAMANVSALDLMNLTPAQQSAIDAIRQQQTQTINQPSEMPLPEPSDIPVPIVKRYNPTLQFGEGLFYTPSVSRSTEMAKLTREMFPSDESFASAVLNAASRWSKDGPTLSKENINIAKENADKFVAMMGKLNQQVKELALKELQDLNDVLKFVQR